ncbi:hypothetical protein [Sulfoacidibacillus thermotolerans]|uniref:hypothetical protein n=1 Tax=Sulfoacidibacillus thermotolerans TaxID=1765684 RepID=UPI0015E80909|nr:hypothetical protein [Sulfoacidibacillus thermotolerans]
MGWHLLYDPFGYLNLVYLCYWRIVTLGLVTVFPNVYAEQQEAILRWKDLAV